MRLKHVGFAAIVMGLVPAAKRWREQRRLELERTGDTPERIAEKAREAHEPSVKDAAVEAGFPLAGTTAQPPGGGGF